MNKIYLCLALMAFLFAGCGDDSSSNVGRHYESVSSLGKCDKEHQGDSVFVETENVYASCQDGFWIYFVEDLDDGGNSGSSSKKSSSSGVNPDGTSDDTVSSSSVHNPEKIEALYVAADDTLFSLKYLNECNSSHEGKYVFVISLSGYMICRDEKWMEFEPPFPRSSSSAVVVDPNNQTGLSDLSNYFDIYKDTTTSSSSSMGLIAPPTIFKADSVFGKCDGSKDGKIFMDSSRVIGVSSDRLYYCKNRVWVAVSTLEANSIALGTADDGTFAEVKYSAYTSARRKISSYCSNKIANGEQYVMDGNWRKASDLEVCFEKMCSFANLDSMYEFKGYWYICRSSGWEAANIFELNNPSFFNEDVEFGSLTDERDGHVYRTVKIGNVTWMAENLNYKGGDSEVGDCYKNDPANCEISGRFYKWADFMNVADSGATLTNHGICPDGWEVPSDTYFRSLFSTNVAAHYSPVAWSFAADSYSFDSRLNTSGFTALGGYLSEVNSYRTGETRFCIASPARGSRYYGVMKVYLSSSTSVTSTTSSNYCSLRCIKSAAEAGEDK